MKYAFGTSKVLITLNAICVKYEKWYAYPSQETLLKLLDKFQHLLRKRRMLNYYLRALEELKLIVRKRRIGYHKVYGLVFKSTMYRITLKGYYYLAREGVDCWDRIRAIEAWLKDKKVTALKPPTTGKRLKDIAYLADLATYREGLGPPG